MLTTVRPLVREDSTERRVWAGCELLPVGACQTGFALESLKDICCPVLPSTHSPPSLCFPLPYSPQFHPLITGRGSDLGPSLFDTQPWSFVNAVGGRGDFGLPIGVSEKLMTI